MCCNCRGIPSKLKTAHATGSAQIVAKWVSPFISHLVSFILIVKVRASMDAPVSPVFLQKCPETHFCSGNKQNYRHILLRVATLVHDSQAWCIIIIHKSVKNIFCQSLSSNKSSHGLWEFETLHSHTVAASLELGRRSTVGGSCTLGLLSVRWG